MIQIIVCILSPILVACAVAVPCAHSYNSKKGTFGKECVALPEDARSLSESFRLENATEPYRSRSMKEFEVLRMYNDMDNGYYVDLGANHWDIDSNTFVSDHFINLMEYPQSLMND